MPQKPSPSPPRSVCLLRLSSLGDIIQTLPIVRTLQTTWPETKLAWIIGKREHPLVADIRGIEFILFDKDAGRRAYADVRRILRGRRFDVLLHMQTAFRASLLSLLVNATIKLGFDRLRAKDGQRFFTNATIPSRRREHVLDRFFGFPEALGIGRRELRWDIPIPEEAARFAESLLPGARPTLAISPCASKSYRDWTVEGYAAVADYAIEKHGMRVVLTGGSTAREREAGASVEERMAHRPINLIGETGLKELLALLARATVLLGPDAGPVHLATAVGTPVIGLYACTNPDRARPYLSAGLVVNRYPAAVRRFLGKAPEDLPWGARVRDPAAMSLIRVEEVIGKLDAVLQSGS